METGSSLSDMEQTLYDNMKFLWVLLTTGTMLCMWIGCAMGFAAPANTSRKLEIEENINPQVFGTAFDEIVVESNLNVRGKSPSSRSQRTQLFPVKANASKSTEPVKAANSQIV